MTKFISAVLLLQLFLAGVAEECASSETSVLLQMGWWHGVEGQAKSKQLEDAPPVDPAYGDDDLGLGSGDLMHPLISLDGALIRQPLSGKGIFHGGITWDSPHWQRHRKLPKGWRMQEILNSAEFFDWVALGLAMILAYILRHYWLWQVAGEKQMASHGVSLLIWLGLGGALAFAISLRFGKGHGEEWIAGYFFEFFFMLENVFVFRAVITALSLSDAMVAKVLDWVVNFQIIFEAVFFSGPRSPASGVAPASTGAGVGPSFLRAVDAPGVVCQIKGRIGRHQRAAEPLQLQPCRIRRCPRE